MINKIVQIVIVVLLLLVLLSFGLASYVVYKHIITSIHLHNYFAVVSLASAYAALAACLVLFILIVIDTI